MSNRDEEEVKSKKKKRRKKKKHRFLKFLLVVLLLVGGLVLNHKLAEKQMQSFIARYPFTFTQTMDSLEYVSGDFSALTVYEVNGKEKAVKWKSSSELVTFDENGNATVLRPENSQKVTVTQTYRLFLGKASVDYTLNIIGTKTLTADEIDVITVEELKNQEYHRDMQAVLNADGTLQYMMGDFRNTVIDSAENAKVLVEAYKENFGISSEVEFRLANIMTSEEYTNYKFRPYFNGSAVCDGSAYVVVKNDNNKLSKLSMTAPIPQELNSEKEELAEETVRSLVETYLQENPKYQQFLTSLSEMQMIDCGSSVNANGYVYQYFFTKGYSMYAVGIQNNEVILFDCGMSLASGEKMVQGDGVNEAQQSIDFDVLEKKSFKKKKYYLEDTNRGIEVRRADADLYDGYKYTMNDADDDSENFFQEMREFGEAVDALAESGLDFYLAERIESETVHYGTNNDVEAECFDAAQQVYDYYYSVLGLNSYDNKGGKVKIITDVEAMYDNAGWMSFFNIVMVFPQADFEYTRMVDPAVMAHEFSHGVFTRYIDGGSADGGALNEAYADIFAYLAVPGANWQIGYNQYAKDIKDGNGNVLYTKGTRTIIRDSKNGSNPMIEFGNECPMVYDVEDWSSIDAHDQSVVVSNVAYKMYASGLFSDSDLATIWYRSAVNGYDANSSLVTCRRYVIQEAEELHCDDEVVDFIAKTFDDAHVYDASYVFKTNQYANPSEPTSDDTSVIITQGNDVDGDNILDDNNETRFMVIYSIADLTLGSGTVTIYEEQKEGIVYDTEENIEKRLAEMINSKYPGINLAGNEITVDYVPASKQTLDFAMVFSQNAKGSLIDIIFRCTDAVGIEMDASQKQSFRDVLENLMPFLFTWEVYEGTAYDFYDELGLID